MDRTAEEQEVLLDDNGVVPPLNHVVYTAPHPVPTDKPFIYATRTRPKEYTPTEHRENQVWTEALEGEENERREQTIKKLSGRFRSTLRPVFHVLRLLVLVALLTLGFWIGTLIIIVNPKWKHGW